MKGVKIILKIIFWLSLVTGGTSFFIQESLPEPSELDSKMKELPQMQDTERENFTIENEGIKANIEAKKEYEIYGLVVADYDSENWLDWTHRYDPFNTKDLCLLWGDNAKVSTFDNYKFWHGEFTCFFKPRKWPLEEELKHQHVSNNHLLPANEEVYRKIKSSRIGDQVYLRGALINYQIETADWQTGFRNSSLDIFDNHCEVIYVDDFKIIQAANTLERKIFKYSVYTFLASLFLIIFIFLVEMQVGWKKEERI